MRQWSRRDFLVTSAGAAATLPVTRIWALPLRQSKPIATHLPDPLSPEQLEILAAHAISVIDAAGGGYGDIRIGERSEIRIASMGAESNGKVSCDLGYSIRALVGGAWGYSFGTAITTEAVSAAARDAVTQARLASKFAGDALRLPPIPIVKETWTTPLDIDPFTVSPDDMVGLGMSIIRLGERWPDSVVEFSQSYSRDTRVFASTEGARIAQKSYNTFLQGRIAVTDWTGRIRDTTPGLAPRSGGFEVAIRPEIYDTVYCHIEEFRRLLRFPHKDVDVGRYAAVLDGRTMASVLGKTVVRALDLDRIIGNQANEAGTSFLTADTKTLGVPQFSQHLTLAVDRSSQSWNYTPWDDEGVATQSFDVIQQGAVVDLLGTRENIGVLESWYRSRKLGQNPRGVARVAKINRKPVASPGVLVVTPGSDSVTLDSLVRDLGDGIFVRGINFSDVHSDFQLSGGMFSPYNVAIFEVKKGEISHRIGGSVAQFRTSRLLKSLVKMGGRASVDTATGFVPKGVPLDRDRQAVSAPAVLVSELDITRRPQYKTGADQRFFEQAS